MATRVRLLPEFMFFELWEQLVPKRTSAKFSRRSYAQHLFIPLAIPLLNQSIAINLSESAFTHFSCDILYTMYKIRYYSTEFYAILIKILYYLKGENTMSQMLALVILVSYFIYRRCRISPDESMDSIRFRLCCPPC